MNINETPRTDVEHHRAFCEIYYELPSHVPDDERYKLTRIHPDFARQLERELNEAKRLLEAHRPHVEQLRITELEKDKARLVVSTTWPHVLKFAERMEAKLAKNRHKGDRDGWLKDHPWALVERILDETVEVQQCFTAIGAHTVNLTRTPEETADECADVANFCMMVADRVTFNQAMSQTEKKG